MIKRAMIKNAKRRILLCDSTKFGHDYFCRACGTEDVDLIITDRYPGEAAAAALQNKLIYKE